MKPLLILLSVFISFHCQSNEIGKTIDMAHPQRISFDSIVETISCVKLEKLLFEACKSMIPYKDHFYFMGSIMAGSNLVMYDKEGKFIKEINFSDALLVNSMCMVPERDELWVTSQFKVLSKYKTDGSLIKRFLLPFNCANIYPVDKQNFLIYSGGGPNHMFVYPYRQKQATVSFFRRCRHHLFIQHSKANIEALLQIRFSR